MDRSYSYKCSSESPILSNELSHKKIAISKCLNLISFIMKITEGYDEIKIQLATTVNS